MSSPFKRGRVISGACLICRLAAEKEDLLQRSIDELEVHSKVETCISCKIGYLALEQAELLQ